MPLYEFECCNCGKSQEFLIGLSELPNMDDDRIVDLGSLKLACSCKCSKFKKLIAAHGKTAVNWGSWQAGLGPKPPAPKCSCKNSCKTKPVRKK